MQDLIFRILFLKILFRAHKVFICVHTFQWTPSEFFFVFFFSIFRFSSRKSQSQQKLAKNITHFTMQFRSKNLTHFRNFNSFDIENNMLPQHSQKPFWGYKFSSKHFSVWCQKKKKKKKKSFCAAPFLDAQELHSWSTFKANVCIFLHKFFPQT